MSDGVSVMEAGEARRRVLARRDVVHVVLFEPEIPPNTGNIGRMCWASGNPLHLIKPLGFDLSERALKRAGLDYWPELELAVWENFEEFEEAWQGCGDRSMYYFTTRGRKAHWDVAYALGDALVFGPETRGLPAAMVDADIERAVRIPMTNGRSLNLATSAGIGLYEALRQCGAELGGGAA